MIKSSFAQGDAKRNFKKANHIYIYEFYTLWSVKK